MDLSVFQRTIVDETGDTLPSAQIDVYLADTTTRPDLFSDKEGTTPITNPFNADVNGFAQFYTVDGYYDVEANLGGSSATWNDVKIGRPLDNIIGAVGNINNTLFELPLNNSSVIAQGVGSTEYTCDTDSAAASRYGVVEYFTIDEARFNAGGFINEEASENEAEYSNNISIVNSTIFNATEDSITALAPDNTNTATTFTNTSDSGGYFDPITVGVASIEYTFSCHYKKGSGLKPRLLIRDDVTSANLGDAIFDIDTMTVTSTSSAGTYSGESARIVESELHADYIKVSLTVTIGADTAIRLYTYSAFTNGLTYTIWGRQMEALPFASNLTTTTTAPNTRAATILTATSENNMPSKKEGAIAIDFKLYSLHNNINHLFGWYASSSNNLRIYVEPNGEIAVRSDSATGGVSPVGVDNININQKYRVMITWKDNIMYMSLDNVLIFTGTWTGDLFDEDLINTYIRIGCYSPVATTLMGNGEYCNLRTWGMFKKPSETELT